MTTKKRAARTTHAYTIKEAAEQLGIGTTQVSQWRAKGLLAEFPDGSLDVAGTWTNANRVLDPTRGGKPDRGVGGRIARRGGNRGELKALGVTRARNGKRRRDDKFLPEDLSTPNTTTVERSDLVPYVCRTEGASSILSGFSRGGHVAGVNKGQFSAWEILSAVLDVTGPARVDIATWTTNGEAVADLARLVSVGRISEIRMILDSSLRTREPAYCDALVRSLGAGAVRTTRNHAKWIVVRNGAWSVVVRGSMNFGTAPRLEYFEVSDDKRLADFLCAIADEMWQRAPVWNFEADGDGVQFQTAAFEGMTPPNIGRLTPAEVASALNLSKNTVTRMRTSGLMTFDDDGCTTLERAQAEVAARMGVKTAISSAPVDEMGDVLPVILQTDSDGIIAAKTQDAIETARWKALRNAKLEGTLIPRDMAAQVYVDALTAMKSSLDSLPCRWRHRFVGLDATEIEKLIRAEAESVLKEVSDALDPTKLGDDN